MINIALSSPRLPRVFNKGDFCRPPSSQVDLTLLFKLVPHYFGTAGMHYYKYKRGGGVSNAATHFLTFDSILGKPEALALLFIVI